MLVFDGMADSEQSASRYTGPSSFIPETKDPKEKAEPNLLHKGLFRIVQQNSQNAMLMRYLTLAVIVEKNQLAQSQRSSPQKKKKLLTRIFPLRSLISLNFLLSSSNLRSNWFCLSFLFSLDWKR